MTSGKALGIGSAFFTTGAGIAVAFAVMNLQAKEEFWTLPVTGGSALAVLGLIILLWGFFIRDISNPESRKIMKQRGGKGSHNYQAGGDITIGDRK